jgi:hypothetical protein
MARGRRYLAYELVLFLVIFRQFGNHEGIQKCWLRVYAVFCFWGGFSVY